MIMKLESALSNLLFFEWENSVQMIMPSKIVGNAGFCGGIWGKASVWGLRAQWRGKREDETAEKHFWRLRGGKKWRGLEKTGNSSLFKQWGDIL